VPRIERDGQGELAGIGRKDETEAIGRVLNECG
jgi:hypothetical protein